MRQNPIYHCATHPAAAGAGRRVARQASNRRTEVGVCSRSVTIRGYESAYNGVMWRNRRTLVALRRCRTPRGLLSVVERSAARRYLVPTVHVLPYLPTIPIALTIPPI